MMQLCCVQSKMHQKGASLAVQWLRICLPNVRDMGSIPVQEDSTCHGITKPVTHNY